MPAHKNNKYAEGQRVKQQRVGLSLSLSERNGLLALATEMLSKQGIEPTEKNIRALANDWFYPSFEAWLKDG